MSARVVVGACGGCGTSLLAGALALLRAEGGDPSLLIELHAWGGDLAAAWDAPAPRTLGDLAAVEGELDAGHVRAVAQGHPSGVALLAAPAAPAPPGALDAAAVGRLMEAARREGEVSVDAGAGGSPRALAAASAAEAVLLVCPRTVAGARRARVVVEGLAARGSDRGCALVATAAPGRRRDLSASGLGRIAGVPVVGELPWEPGEAAELGAGLLPRGRRRPLRDAVRRIAGAAG